MYKFKAGKLIGISILVASFVMSPSFAAPMKSEVKEERSVAKQEEKKQEQTKTVVKVKEKAEENKDYEYRYTSLRANYVYKTEMKESSAAMRAAKIVSAAYSYLGVPYRMGGTSRSGIDCSGLAMRAHEEAGISLPRTSGAQGSGGKRVESMEQALPGDLVCYRGHVGIYIGEGEMIHAPRPGRRVEVLKIYGNPWFKRYW